MLIDRFKAALRKPGFIIGLTIIVASIIVALFPGAFAAYDPTTMDYTTINQPPSLLLQEQPPARLASGRNSIRRPVGAAVPHRWVADNRSVVRGLAPMPRRSVPRSQTAT